MVFGKPSCVYIHTDGHACTYEQSKRYICRVVCKEDKVTQNSKNNEVLFFIKTKYKYLLVYWRIFKTNKYVVFLLFRCDRHKDAANDKTWFYNSKIHQFLFSRDQIVSSGPKVCKYWKLSDYFFRKISEKDCWTMINLGPETGLIGRWRRAECHPGTPTCCGPYLRYGTLDNEG